MRTPATTHETMTLRILAGTLDALVGGAVVFDAGYRVLHWNRTLESWTGVAAARAQGSDLRTLLPALRRTRYELRIEEVLNGAPAATFDSVLHASILEADRGGETPTHTRVHVSSFFDWHSKERRALLTLEDTSRLHALHDELRSARDDALRAASRERDEQTALRQERDHLEASNEELQQFAYMASHDLREPLHKVRMFASLLETDVEDLLDGEALDMVRRIGTATERLEDLLTESLALLRAGEAVDASRTVDCGAILEDAVDDLETRIEEADAVVDVGTIPPVHADPVSIHHLALNLVSNALKFRHPERRCHLEIDAARGSLLTADGELDAIRLTFRDNGIGFDPRYATEIFKPFRRLHGRSDSYRGHGLGLAICRRIVRRNGGQIWAESRPGEGSTFHVMLPAAVETEATADDEAPPTFVDGAVSRSGSFGA
mgnify:CR=1 FL=1